MSKHGFWRILRDIQAWFLPFFSDIQAWFLADFKGYPSMVFAGFLGTSKDGFCRIFKFLIIRKKKILSKFNEDVTF
jgi:hypothetical protein